MSYNNMGSKNIDVLDLEYTHFLKNYEEILKKLPSLLKLTIHDSETTRKLAKATDTQSKTFLLCDAQKSVLLECIELQEKSYAFEKQIIALKEEAENVDHFYKSEIGRLNNMIIAEKEQAKLMKIDFEKRDKDLKNEILHIQASARKGYDEMEERLLSSLSDLTEKLHESNNICNGLRAKNFSLQKQLNCGIESSKQLETRLRAAEEKLQILESNSNNIRNDRNSVYWGPVIRNSATDDGINLHGARENIVDANKYVPLDTVRNLNTSSSKLIDNTDLNKVYISGSYKKVYRNNSPFRIKSYVPDLIKLSIIKDGSCSAQKKRKLYNPDDAEFVKHIVLE